MMMPCKGIEIEPGVFSGCSGGADCLVCHGQNMMPELQIKIGSYWNLSKSKNGVAVVLMSGEKVFAQFPNTQAGWEGTKEDFIRDFTPYNGDRTWVDEAIKRDWHYYFTYLGKPDKLGVC